MATEPTQLPMDRMRTRAMDFKRRWPGGCFIEGLDVEIEVRGNNIAICVFGPHEVRTYSACGIRPVVSSFETGDGRLYQQLGELELILRCNGTRRNIAGYDVARVEEAIIGDNGLPWAIQKSLEDAKVKRGD